MSGQTWLENISRDFPVGDRVQVGSVVTVRAARKRRSQHARGVVDGYNDVGIIVRFDSPVNGVDWCTASPEELRRLT
ncbi:hypothetical protein [Mycobacterium lehmannii]|uniref:hypothetical protein n=1 Tax=Mycobacterium lehmannii TaxID=2048550 RepID=UPI000B93FDE3|nr:hypothetical protein [Mycobacterium lehmannii]